MTDRKLVPQVLDSFSVFNGGSIDVQIKRLEAFKTAYGEYSNLRIEVREWGYDGGQEWEVVGDRLETDRELKDRLAKEARFAELTSVNAKKKLAKDFKEYKRLKKLFKDE